mmetsp:Transcript_32183/g.91692  ORF Transcript_32183/g.91692 Transcript_32183/m.91692 type:complete len:215 (-) Transcript_32183:942-1586(-)
MLAPERAAAVVKASCIKGNKAKCLNISSFAPAVAIQAASLRAVASFDERKGSGACADSIPGKPPSGPGVGSAGADGPPRGRRVGRSRRLFCTTSSKEARYGAAARETVCTFSSNFGGASAPSTSPSSASPARRSMGASMRTERTSSSDASGAKTAMAPTSMPEAPTKAISSTGRSGPAMSSQAPGVPSRSLVGSKCVAQLVSNPKRPPINAGEF